MKKRSSRSKAAPARTAGRGTRTVETRLCRLVLVPIAGSRYFCFGPWQQESPELHAEVERHNAECPQRFDAYIQDDLPAPMRAPAAAIALPPPGPTDAARSKIMSSVYKLAYDGLLEPGAEVEAIVAALDEFEVAVATSTGKAFREMRRARIKRATSSGGDATRRGADVEHEGLDEMIAASLERMDDPRKQAKRWSEEFCTSLTTVYRRINRAEALKIF